MNKEITMIRQFGLRHNPSGVESQRDRALYKNNSLLNLTVSCKSIVNREATG